MTMSRIKKYDKSNKNYFLSELDEHTLKIRAVMIRTAAIAAAVVYAPFIVLYITVGYAAPSIVEENYSGISTYIALTFLLPVALVWCAVMSFLSYTPVREIPERKSPPGGFRLVPYVGMFAALLLAAAFAVYHTVLTVLAGSIPSDIAGAIILWASAALTAAMYVIAFLTYRASVLIEVETDSEAERESIALPTFHLSAEEIERGKEAFAPEKEKPRKNKKDPPSGANPNGE